MTLPRLSEILPHLVAHAPDAWKQGNPTLLPAPEEENGDFGALLGAAGQVEGFGRG